MKLTFKNSVIDVESITIKFNEASNFMQFDKMIDRFIAYVSASYSLETNKTIKDQFVIETLVKYNPVMSLRDNSVHFFFVSSIIQDKVLKELNSIN